MKFLIVKEILMERDNRESNILKRNEYGEPIEFKQSENTCRIIFQDKEGEEYSWVAENKDLANAIKLIGLNEDKKYPNGLGRNLFFLSWLYEFYEKYLKNFGLKVPIEHLEKARRFKYGKFNN